MKRLLLPLIMLGVACAAKPVTSPPNPGMTPRDHQGLALSSDASLQILVNWRRAVREEKEPAACVLDYRIRPDSTVDVYTLTLALTDSSSLHYIWGFDHYGMCKDGQPSIHGHVSREYFAPEPSPIDSAIVRRLNAPFHLIVFRLDTDTTFGVKLFWKPAP